MRPAVPFLATLVTSISSCAGAPSRPAVPAGCAKDTDCKGERVCERGACVEPAPPPPPPVDAAPPPRPAGPPPYAMARGGPRHLGRVSGRVPLQPPAAIW